MWDRCPWTYFSWAEQGPFCNWISFEHWIGLETSGHAVQHKLCVLNFYSPSNVTKMRDVSYCLQWVSQTPLGLPCKVESETVGQRPLSRDISLHVSQPPVTIIPKWISSAPSHDKCRHLTPEATGRAGWDPGNLVRRNHHQQLCLLGMSSKHSPGVCRLLKAGHTAIPCLVVQILTCRVFVCLFSAVLPLLFLCKSSTSHTFYCGLWTSPLASC